MSDGAPDSTAEAKAAGPLVMAYIGDDDPNRGDSKAAIGLSRLVAEMLHGRYVYVDEAMLEKNFPALDGMSEQLRAYLKQNGDPDIAIGSYATEVSSAAVDHPPTLVVDDVNESMSSARANNSELVSHHLTKELLKAEAEKFRQHYPGIRGPLVAVMLGGEIYSSNCLGLARKLSNAAQQYPEITYFICPSRRTGDMKKKLVTSLLKAGPVGDGIRNLFNYAVRALGLTAVNLPGNMNVLSVNYKAAKNGYNPYLGLLGAADHIVVAGESYSLVSEALFTGKNIYVYKPGNEYPTLISRGYVVDIEDDDCKHQFPTEPMEPLDLTGSVAKSIVEEYGRKLKDRQTNAAAAQTGAPAPG